MAIKRKFNRITKLGLWEPNFKYHHLIRKDKPIKGMRTHFHTKKMGLRLGIFEVAQFHPKFYMLVTPVYFPPT
ncbi:12097_t:CDS:2 [Funneliformis mosseae]|uniref:12097_t:CDS:1 n=1 Tax=Funneliformis mosseae TaxID=27381 RepID=A0A9N9D9Y2_FUNMO|nr:12097_t:CDS:2 [Funneliformis mosseae]